ncbi:ankyrin [Daldinia eschscholtzii]|nr:ankyrin [Daldinia eschscholtzii]
MESEQSIITRDTPVSDQLWLDWKDFIYEEYIVNDRKIDEVFESLKQRNPHVTMAQYRTKLKDWAFCKNLSAENWRYVTHSIQKRASQNKDTTIVLSGKRLPQAKVKKLTGRHKAVTLYNKWRPPPSPEPPGADIPLFICTPRATSPVTTLDPEWPEDLPWVQFCENVLPQLMCGLTLLENDTSAANIESRPRNKRLRERRQSNAHMAWAAFEILVRQSMRIAIGSDELVETLLLRKSVDRIAGHLDKFIPPTFANENLRRAVTLTGGTRREVQKEILKIILFLASNNLILNGPNYYEEARAFMDVFRMSGLAEKHTLTRIVTISLGSLTMTYVLDKLYEAAVATEAADLIFALLDADKRMNPDRPAVPVQSFELFSISSSALYYALSKGSAEFVRHMLRAGADPRKTSYEGYTSLMFAILGPYSSVRIQLIQLLEQQGAISKSEDELSMALFLAIMKGDFQIIDLLCELGAELGFTCPVAKLTSNDRDLSSAVDYITCLGLAAKFKAENYDWSNSSSDETTDDEDTSLRLVKHILDRAGPEFDIDHRHKSDAIIFASRRGYNSVISFLHCRGARLSSRNGCLDPISAAVIWANVETCRLLLELGASIHADPRPRRWFIGSRNLRRFSGVGPTRFSLLHIAVHYNSYAIAELLIRAGADINYVCRIYHHDETKEIGSGYIFQIKSLRKEMYYEEEEEEEEEYDDDDDDDDDDEDTVYTYAASPLHLAIDVGAWEIALLLANSGATPTRGDLYRSAEAGQYQLVSQLLRLGVETDEVADALQISLSKGHELAALELLKSGVGGGYKNLTGALARGQHRIAMKLIDSGVQLDQAELAYAFRLPNVLIVRSILQAQLLDVNNINQRSPDGRTFLENAILSGDISVMRYALSLDITFYYSGALCAALTSTVRSPLIGIDEILKELLSRRGSAKDSPYYDQILENTAVSMAAYYGRIDVAAYIRETSNWVINIAILPKSIWSYKICLEEETGMTEEGRLRFRRHQIDISIATKYNVSIPALADWNDWHDPDKWLVSPLFLAVKSGNEEAVEALLDLGYEPDGHSLKAAILQGFSNSLITRLTKTCTDINALGAVDMILSDPPVYLAAKSANIDLVRSLLDAGADVNAGGNWVVREKTLSKLIISENHDMLHLLLQYGVDLKSTPLITGNVVTALRIAIRQGYFGIVRQLLACGANPNVKRSEEKTLQASHSAVYDAVACGRFDIIALLLKSGLVTEGPGQVPYTSAVLLAWSQGRRGITNILVSQRKWVADDFIIPLDLLSFANNKRTGSGLKIPSLGRFLYDTFWWLRRDHPFSQEDYPEMAKMVAKLAKRDRVDLNQSIRWDYGIEVNTILRLAMELASTNGYIENQADPIPIACVRSKAADQDSHLSRKQIDPEEEADLPSMEMLESADAAEDISNTHLCFDITEDNRVDIQLGPHLVDEEEEERKRQILDDILGEREAPFETIEWQW